MLKVCIQLHIDTPDTPNWYIKHHQGLEYLNIAMAQVTDNPAMAEGASLNHDVSQRIHDSILIFSLSIEQARSLMKKQFFTESKHD